LLPWNFNEHPKELLGTGQGGLEIPCRGSHFTGRYQDGSIRREIAHRKLNRGIYYKGFKITAGH
jgi:hypothetical protein